MLATLLLTAILLQPPRKAATPPPPQPVPAKAPATPPPKPSGSAIDQLSPQQRRIINDRAKDFYLLPNGSYADAYRLHRIRELLAKGTAAGERAWQSINYTDAQKLGMGHLDNDSTGGVKAHGKSAPLTDQRNSSKPIRPTYKDLPDLITLSPKNADAVIICDAPHLGAAPLVPGMMYGAAIPEIEVSPRCVTTIPHKVTIVQILDEHNAIAKMSHARVSEPPAGVPKEGFHITTPTTGLRDAQVYPGDFILIPQGTEHYKNFAGVRATTASYQLIPLTTPVTPEALAESLRDGKATINTYSTSTGAGNAIQWKATPIKFTFK